MMMEQNQIFIRLVSGKHYLKNAKSQFNPQLIGDKLLFFSFCFIFKANGI